MKNLRGISEYNIGLDIGTGSVGWAVTDLDGELCRFKSKPTWGSRVFPSAETAASARVPRGQRRRYERRRQRLNYLQEFFAEAINETDPTFFVRLNQSRLLPQDRKEGGDYRWPLFNGSDFTEVDYYKRFPTIYHLRSWLMEADEQADIRLIYLAFHNIVKHRGNFLYQDTPSLSASNANAQKAAEDFCLALQEWCEFLDASCSCDAAYISSVVEDASLSKRSKQENITSHIVFEGMDAKTAKAVSKEIGNAIVGYKTDFSKLFQIEAEKSKFELGNDEAVEEFQAQCPDECLAVFEALRTLYSAFVLAGILKDGAGETISFIKVREYERYGNDLALLKELVKEFASKQYDEFFRGETYEGTTSYDASKAKGYTRYNLGPSKVGSGAKPMKYEDFQKEVQKLFEGTAAVEDGR